MPSSRTVLIALDHVEENINYVLLSYSKNYLEMDDRVVLLSVHNYSGLEVPYLISSDEPTVNLENWNKSFKESREMVHKQLNKAREFLVGCSIDPLKIDTYFRETNQNFGPEIVCVAEEVKPDLIILGRHKRSTISRVLIGSTSTYVVHHTLQPTILVTLLD